MTTEKRVSKPGHLKGELIETVCVLMMFVFAVGGILAALMFGMSDPVLTTAWIVGGLISAAFWYVLSGLGALIRWHEFNYQESVRIK